MLDIKINSQKINNNKLAKNKSKKAIAFIYNSYKKYLGINLTKQVKEFYKEKHLLMKEIEENTHKKMEDISCSLNEKLIFK